MSELRGVSDINDLKPCDLVMKGGISSGVVYPAAVDELSKEYRFCSVGGTSAGAIAAAATAAAEYGRQSRSTGEGSPSGFERLGMLSSQLSTPGFIIGLFRPAPRLHVLFEIMVMLSTKGKGVGGKARVLLKVVLKHFWQVAILSAFVGVVALWLLVLAFSGSFATVPAVSLGLVFALGAAMVGMLMFLGLRAKTAYTNHLSDNYFGLCTGMANDQAVEVALTDWLHGEIQECAGRRVESAPITLAELREEGIELQMMTTDLTRARPTRMPADLLGFWFCEQEMNDFFPPSVVTHLTEHSRNQTPVERNGRRYWRLSDDVLQLPVIVATRLSLSFPLLLSGIPLYTESRDGELLKHWFSDGGIGSNFPIHFFDSWLPSRPTFGLDLRPTPKLENRPSEKDFGGSFKSLPVDTPAPRRAEIMTFFGFMSQIFDTMQNWRDTMQAELPGFSDRVRPIYLQPNEGGMNLDMDTETVKSLMEKGRAEGEKLRDDFRLDLHLFTRYLTFMQMMDTGLRGSDDNDGLRANFASYRADLEGGPPEDSLWTEGHDNEWCREAAKATRTLLDSTSGWGPRPDKVPFNDNNEPTPTPVMRITPSV